MFNFISASLAFALILPFVNAEVHQVQVGPTGNLTFSPVAIFAGVGDQVIFNFNPKNHSVTQSTLQAPCSPKAGGIDSGFMAVPAGSANQPTFTVSVTDTNPIWIHCAQTNPKSHCGAGMVFAINCGPPGSPNGIDVFQSAAAAFGASQSAGATTTYTAAYGTATVPPPPVGDQVTQPITLGTSSWTTTYTSYAGSPNPTPAAPNGATHTVLVGANGLTYTPSRIDAQPRDVVVFEFHAKNHTVTQSAFADPCRKLTQNGAQVGFDSGFMPVDASATTFPTWSITVNDTAPIWAYCRQSVPSSHCGQGMVFAINSVETGSRNFAAFQALAKQLNGTQAALAAPAPSPSTKKSAASSLRLSSGFSLALAAVVLALL